MPRPGDAGEGAYPDPHPPAHPHPRLGLGLTALLAGTLLLAIAGPAHIPLSVVTDSIRRAVSHAWAGPQSQLASVFWYIRLPPCPVGPSSGPL